MFMQTRLFWLLSIALLVLWGSLTQASAQAPLSSDKTSTGATALTATSLPFQGNLYNAGEPINGACDLKFTLYDSAQSGSKVGSDLFRLGAAVSDGYFSTMLDFGDVVGDAARWLETAVRCPTGQGIYVILTPRQEIGWIPRAYTAQRVLNLNSAPGDFVANGLLRSTRNDPQDTLAGGLEVINGSNDNRWQMGIGRRDDVLVLGFIPAGGAWLHAATFEADGDLVLVHDLYLNGVVTSNLAVNGVLRSARGLTEDTSTGLLELENTLTNNKWHITSNRDTDDLQIWFAENGNIWSHAATLERDGDFTVNNRLHVVGNSLNFMNDPAGILWRDGGAAIGHALNSGDYSSSAQPGDLVVRADDGRRILLGRGSAAANFPAALTVAANGQVSIPNLQTGGIVEVNLQTSAELAMPRIERFVQGDVLCWDAAQEMLALCSERASTLIVAIADVQGKPLIAGVEPVRVCGAVRPGDLLISSTQPGCAEAWPVTTSPNPPTGVVIAKSLGVQVDGEGLVKAMILAH